MEDNAVQKIEAKREKADIHIITDVATKYKIKSDAAAARLSISEYCLNMISKGKVVSPLSWSELRMLRELSSLASNTNQIAKKLNQSSNDKITIALAEEIIQTIHSVLSSIQNKK